jgi:hypothetical protein
VCLERHMLAQTGAHGRGVWRRLKRLAPGQRTPLPGHAPSGGERCDASCEATRHRSVSKGLDPGIKHRPGMRSSWHALVLACARDWRSTKRGAGATRTWAASPRGDGGRRYRYPHHYSANRHPGQPIAPVVPSRMYRCYKTPGKISADKTDARRHHSTHRRHGLP